MENTIELNLRELIAVIVRKLWLIVLSAVLVGAIAFLYTAKFVTPLYKASVTIYVNNTIYGEKDGITSNDLTTSQKLVTTYMQVIKSNSFLSKVSQELDNKISTEKLAASLTTQTMSNTEMFSVVISYSDPKIVTQIANTIAELAVVEIPKVVDGSSSRIVDYAEEPTKPYFPSYSKNVMLGACIGAMAVIIVLVVQMLMDLHIKGEEDLGKFSDAPVLGYIPHYNTVDKENGYAYEAAIADDEEDGGVMQV